MTALYYTSFEGTEFYPERLSLSQYRRKRLDSQSNLLAGKQGIAAELLLIYALKTICPELSLPLDISCKEGKPFLNDIALNFSLSHSGCFAACVVSDGVVGLDIQHEVNSSDKLAARWLSPEEYSFYSGSDDKKQAFFKIWTMKESYVKASGRGIKSGLKGFSVLSPGSGVSFWHKAENNMHFALAFIDCEESCPDKFEYVPIEKLLV